jgi:hypothetical protein
MRGQVGEYTAHEAEGEEYEQFWQQAVNTSFVFPLYRQRVANARRMPIMIMTPVEKQDEPYHAYNVSGLPDRAHNRWREVTTNRFNAFKTKRRPR